MNGSALVSEMLRSSNEPLPRTANNAKGHPTHVTLQVWEKPRTWLGRLTSLCCSGSSALGPITDKFVESTGTGESYARAHTARSLLVSGQALELETHHKLRLLGCAATFRGAACGALVRFERRCFAKAFGPSQHAVVESLAFHVQVAVETAQSKDSVSLEHSVCQKKWIRIHHLRE